jgi:hypothetical protein
MFARATPFVFTTLFAALLAGCAAHPPQPACFNVQGSTELRTKDARTTLAELEAHIRLSPEDEALRSPKSIADIRTILRRDAVYLFANAATYARSLGTLDGKFSEAYLELLLGESQLVASQVLTMQAAQVGVDLRIARANLASEGSEPATDRGRMLAQLIRVVEEGNKIADALGAVAPSHLSRGAEVIRELRAVAPTDARTSILLAEYHRLRGEWAEFDVAIQAAEGAETASPVPRYLRAMEQAERYRRPDLGTSMMRDCLASYPKFVRGQAALVLMARSPSEGLRELDALRRLNEDHYLVMLLTPTLAAEQELARMQGIQLGAAPHAPR